MEAVKAAKAARHTTARARRGRRGGAGHVCPATFLPSSRSRGSEGSGAAPLWWVWWVGGCCSRPRRRPRTFSYCAAPAPPPRSAARLLVCSSGQLARGRVALGRGHDHGQGHGARRASMRIKAGAPVPMCPCAHRAISSTAAPFLYGTYKKDGKTGENHGHFRPRRHANVKRAGLFWSSGTMRVAGAVPKLPQRRAPWGTPEGRWGGLSCCVPGRPVVGAASLPLSPGRRPAPRDAPKRARAGASVSGHAAACRRVPQCAASKLPPASDPLLGAARSRRHAHAHVTPRPRGSRTAPPGRNKRASKRRGGTNLRARGRDGVPGCEVTSSGPGGPTRAYLSVDVDHGGQQKSQCLAGTRGRDTDHVAPEEGHWPALGLDRGRCQRHAGREQ